MGKRVMKTRGIDAKTGAPCTYGQSFMRNFFGIIFSLIPPHILDVVFILVRKDSVWAIVSHILLSSRKLQRTQLKTIDFISRPLT